MNVSDIIDLARTLSNTNVSQVSNSNALKFLNIVKNNLWSSIITAVNENRNWQEWETDITNGTFNYNIPLVASDTTGAKKLKGVSINYDGNTYQNGRLEYFKADLVDLNNLENDWNYYLQNQPKDKPIYRLVNDYIFIAPLPDKDISNGLLLRGIKNILDYDINTTESEIGISQDYHELLVQGLLPYMYKLQGDLSKANSEKGEYERLKKEALKNLAERNTAPHYMSLPL